MRAVEDPDPVLRAVQAREVFSRRLVVLEVDEEVGTWFQETTRAKGWRRQSRWPNPRQLT